MSAAWRKSSYSGNEGNCVEVGTVPGLVAVRDTKDQASGPVLRVTAEAWQTFTSGIN